MADSIAPVLLIDRSGTGGFPAGETEQVSCSGTDTAGHYLYNGIHWDTDQNGRDFFCFAVAVPDTGTPKALSEDSNGQWEMDNVQLENDGYIMESRFVSCDKSPKGTINGNSPFPIARYKLSPNPNHGRFVVEVEYPGEQDVTVTVHDADGRLLLTMTGKGRRTYRFEGLVETAGTYLVDIASQSGRKTLKMVVN